MAAKKKTEQTQVETEQTPAENEQTPETELETITLTAEEFHQVQERMETLQKEKDETVALLQRNQADFENFRRRNAQVRKDSLDDGKRDCVTQLLPVLDDFERALAAGDGDAAWLEGVKLVQKKLLATLAKLGLEEIEADGKFDASLHNAVMSEAVADTEPGTIIAVLQKGYRMGDRVLRYAMVNVAE